jgi:predicted dehydrogenase
MSPDVKFIFLGATHPHAGAHLRTLERMDEVASVLLWDEDREALERLRSERGAKVEGVTTDLDEALGRTGAAFAFVALRNDRTPDAVIRAARAGKHIMSEKPMGTNASGIRRALEEVRRAGVTLGVCYPNRCNPIARDIRRFVEAGVLGRILSVEMRLLTSQVKFRDPGHWLFRRAEAGGGILSWLGCHYLDLARFLLDDEIVSVSAMADTLGGEAIEVEDMACLSLRFAGGALGTFQCGYVLPRSESGYSGASYDSYIGIRGTLGRIAWHPFEREATGLRVESVAPGWEAAPGRVLQYEFAPSDAYGGAFGIHFMRDFMNAARSGGPPPAGGEDALRVMRVIEAAYESSRTGGRIDLSYE